MTTLASLRILLGLDAGGVSGAARAVQGDLRGVQAEARNTQTRLNEIGKGVVAGFGLGAGISTFNVASRAVSEFTDFLGDSVRAAAEEEAGIARLNQALAANVQGYSGDRSAIEKAISAREQLGFADDALRDSLSGLVAATHDVNRALEIQSAAEDLARFKRISLQEASDALVKVEAGRFRILASLGIQLKDNATQEDALRAVQAVAAGQAEAFGKTTEGAMARAQIAVHNLEEEIGSKLIPLLGEAANVINGALAPSEADLTDQTQYLGAVIGKLASDPVAALNGGLAELAGQAVAAEINTGKLAQSQLEATRAAHALSERTDENVHDFGNAADALKGLDATFTDAADSARTLNDAAAAAAKSLNEIPRDVNVVVNISTNTATDIHGKVIDPGLANTVGNLFATGTALADERDRQAREKAERDGAAAHEKALRDAAAADARYASEMRDHLKDAYQSVDDAAKRYFSDVHTARLKDIDEARRAADDLIEQQKRANLQPVTEAEATLRAIQQQRQLGQLQSQLAAAQTPEDKLRAQQALNDFEAQARIDTLRANADAANAKLDIKKTAVDDQATQAKTAEDQRYQDQLRAFADDEKALKKHLDDATGHWDTYFKEIARLAKRYGVSDLVGVYPNPATSTGRKAEAAASVTAATPDYPVRRPNDVSSVRMDTTAERPIVVYIYLDGEDITSKVDIRQGTRQSIVTSGGIAR